MSNKLYTKEEIEFICQNYKSMTAREIAIKLGRTKSGIENKIHSLSIEKCDSEERMQEMGSLNGEIWKDVFGYEGLYKISNYGRIKFLYRVNNRNETVKERILKQAKDGKGYHFVNISKNGNTKQLRDILLLHKHLFKTPINFLK